ncbi:Spermidine synthase [hydrothermal vent metagenome]|uniref:Spermidine synthase n=1 Tax=hydrothermal vent metagenome TaxID=652676 RepID=A0A3B1BD75_9ZZZZ
MVPSNSSNAASRRYQASTASVYLIFTASGAAALVYQVIWARWLGLIFGNTATSISIVLASFMLGLALGSYLIGKRLHTIKNPMIIYAYLELGIGLFAICFPILAVATDWLYSLIISAETPLAVSLLVRALFAFGLLLIPTTFMGATLPLLTDFFRRDPRHTNNWKVGLLYAANTIGAAVGTIVASFILIEMIGVRYTALCAAGLNFLVAILGFRFARLTTLRATTKPSEKRLPLSIMGKTALVVLAVSGAIALGSEVLWTRVLEILMGSSTYAFATILVVYLIGIAAGSWLMSLAVPRLKSLGIWLAGMQISMGCWTIIAITLFTVLAEHIAQQRWEYISLPETLSYYLWAACLLLPMALFSGATFPLATRLIQPQHEDAEGTLIARAYTWNTVGALLGSLIAGFVIAVLFDYFQSIYLLVIFYGMVGLAAMFMAVKSPTEPRNRMVASGLAILAVGITVYGITEAADSNRFAERIRIISDDRSEISFHKTGLQGVTSVIRERGEKLGYSLVVNGTGMTVKVTDTKMMSHLPMLLHPSPDDTLVICFGMGTTFRSAITYGKNVTVVELVAEVLDAFEQFYDDAERVRAYKNGRMIVNDGRNYLRLTEDKYDVITVDPPPPIDGRGVTNLYSKEFIELAKSRLKKGGIMAHWIPAVGSSSGVDDLETVNMLMKTFNSVFPYTAIKPSLNAVGTHVLGSMEPIVATKEILNQHLSRAAVALDIMEWQPVPISFFAQLEPMPQFGAETPILTDDRPYLEFNMIRYWKAGLKEQYPLVYW